MPQADLSPVHPARVGSRRLTPEDLWAVPRVGEHRYLRFAFRKFGGGPVSVGFDHADKRERLARFDAGTGPPSYGFARRIWIWKIWHVAGQISSWR